MTSLVPEPSVGAIAAGAEPSRVLAASAATTLSLTALAPPRQGDAISGLSLAVAGVGPAAASALPSAAWPQDVGASDAWAVAANSETGWYVLLSQDCDIVRDPAAEPTVLVAPLVLVDQPAWNVLARTGYSPRRYAYPAEKFGLPDGMGLAVDLAWTTSVLKGALAAPGVRAVRPLTGPNKLAFREWLSARTGRAPFLTEVNEKVLDPFYELRRRLSQSFDKASSGAAARIESRAAAAVVRWYASVDTRRVDILGELSRAGLVRAALLTEDGRVDEAVLEDGRAKLEASTVKKMAQVDDASGWSIKVTLADLTRVSAASFQNFALLLR